MKKLISVWLNGWKYLFSDEGLNSFYTFFTVIFAECAYLWAFYEASVAIPLIAILLGYVLNVILTAKVKGDQEGTKWEALFSFLYLGVFMVLSIIGSLVNLKVMLIMIAIAFFATVIGIFIGTLVICVLPILSLITSIGGPFIAFTICLSKVPTLPILYKFIIPIVYLLCIPFIVVYEDESSALNIFELACNITWIRQRKEEKELFK